MNDILGIRARAGAEQLHPWPVFLLRLRLGIDKGACLARCVMNQRQKSSRRPPFSRAALIGSLECWKRELR